MSPSERLLGLSVWGFVIASVATNGLTLLLAIGCLMNVSSFDAMFSAISFSTRLHINAFLYIALSLFVISGTRQFHCTGQR